MPIEAAPDEPGKRHRSVPPAARGKENGGPGPTHRSDPRPGRGHLPRSWGLRGRCRLCGPAGSGLCPLPRRVRGRRRRRPKHTAPPCHPGHRPGKWEPFQRPRPPPSRPTPQLPPAHSSVPAAPSLELVEKFGALLRLPLSISPSLVTGVNTDCFAQALGQPRPECDAS